jgi:hypothetical protein
MPFESGLIQSDDVLQIENVLYKQKENELVARKIFAPNNSYDSFAGEIGYDYYTRQGSAKIFSRGSSAKDIPFVGEKGGRVTQSVYDIYTGVRYTKKEIQAMNAKRSLGKGPTINIETLRVDTARRYINESFNKICLVGDSTISIKGVLDNSFYGVGLGTKENVAQGATGADAAAKRLWANKTPQEIINDLNTGLGVVEKDGLFKGKILVVPPSRMTRLRKPYSDHSPMTTLNWIKSEGMYFDDIIVAKELEATINGDTVAYFMILDNDPEVIEHVITEDLTLGEQVKDIIGTVEMAVSMSTAGVIFRHPAGCYIGKGI